MFRIKVSRTHVLSYGKCWGGVGFIVFYRESAGFHGEGDGCVVYYFAGYPGYALL